MAGLRAGAALGPAELRRAARAERRRQRAGAGRGELGALDPAASRWRGRRRVAAHASATFSSPRRWRARRSRRRRARLPFAWLSSDAEDGPALAARLAAAQVYVAPGRLWGDERHVRAALRGPQAIDRLAAALRS